MTSFPTSPAPALKGPKNTRDVLGRKALRAITAAGLDYVRPKIRSRTLRRALNRWIPTDQQGYIQIPHYWALYVHDGRGTFAAPPGKYLVWFRNPKDDPRLRGGVTPVRAADLRHLQPSEFYHWLRENAIARAEGRDPPMVVTRAVRKGVPPARFFENDGGMAGFAAKANDVANPIVREHILDKLEDILNVTDSAKALI